MNNAFVEILSSMEKEQRLRSFVLVLKRIKKLKMAGQTWPGERFCSWTKKRKRIARKDRK